MDVSGVFNRIRNTLTSTVNEISSALPALPGNPLLREYDIKGQTGSAGPGLMWKIYEGVKKSTKVEVAVWVLEKKLMEQYQKNEREIVLDVYRQGCMQLTKLRHPRVLIVEHSLEESRDSLCFCTEPVFASLANVLGERLNISNTPNELMTYNLHEVEIKYGLMQVSEALAFLHGSAKMIHGNVCPEAIVLSKTGAWKIAGFEFCIASADSSTDVQYQCKEWDTSLPSVCIPNPNYIAPEYMTSKSCDTASDLFSLGSLLYAVYYKGKTLLQCSSYNIYNNCSKNLEKLENINSETFEEIPNEVHEHEKMLLNPDPNVRPDAEQMSKLPFFNHIGVRTLQYLDSLLQRDNLQRSQFFKGLPKILPQLPKRVLMLKVLPSLTSEFCNPDMIPFVLPSIMAIAEDCDKEEFVTHIFPPLIPVFKLQTPVQILLILLQKMELILSKTPSKMIQNHVLPMLGSALTSPSIQIQELCMSIIPTFADRLDIQAMKTSILPKIRNIAIEGSTISIRIHALVCVGKLIGTFDKWFIQDEVLPFFEQISCKEPGVLMAILGVYQIVLKSDKLGLSKHVMATRSLPFLIPLSIESTLNLKQYLAFMSVIKEMLRRIETEHCDKLEQLGQGQLEHDAALDFQNDKPPSIAKPAVTNVDDIFTQTKKEPASSPQVKRQHLTLDEKQRLAKMKELEYRMKKEGDLTPVNTVQKPSTSSVPSKPKDLTSTLMNNNLSAMSISTPMNNTMRPLQTHTNNNPGFGRQTNSQFNAPKQAPQWGTMTPAYSNTTPSYSAAPSPYTNSAAGMFRPQNTSQMNSVCAPQSRSGSLTGFDNLLSMPSHRKPVPMNQMMSAPMGNSQTGLSLTPNVSMTVPQQLGNVSMVPQQLGNVSMVPQQLSSSNVNVLPSNKLSKDELLDFLG